MSALETLWDVATLGGSCDAREAERTYRECRSAYDWRYNEYASALRIQDELITRIGVVVSMSTELMQDAICLLKDNNDCELHSLMNAEFNSCTPTSLMSAEGFLVSYRINAMQACAAGLMSTTTAAGIWSRMALTGTASTGTAIAGLSGVAASKATFAAIGGGSLLSGGTGVAGGTCALGAIAFLPISYVLYGGYSRKAEAYHNASDAIRTELKRIKAERVRLINQNKQLEVHYEHMRSAYGLLTSATVEAKSARTSESKVESHAKLATAIDTFISKFRGGAR